MHQISGSYVPQISGSQLSNWNIKHYKSVEIWSIFQNVKSTCANVIPPIEDLLATVLIWNSHHSARWFRCVRFIAVWKSNKHANREPSSSTNWVHFACVLLVCVKFVQPWWASRNVVPTLCFNVFMPPYIGALWLVFMSTDKKGQMWNLQKCRPCVFSNISTVAFSLVRLSGN